MIVLGIDPGLRTCGFALLEATSAADVRVLDLGLWITSPEGTIRERLAELKRDVRSYLTAAKPAAVVAEIPTFPRDSASAAMLWAAYAALGTLAEENGARWAEMTTAGWRNALGLPQEKSGAPRAPKGVQLTPAAQKQLEREQARCGAQAKARRKRSTKDLMLARFPGARTLLASTPGALHEHPLDALAIGCAWVELATRTPAKPAQGELAW